LELYFLSVVVGMPLLICLVAVVGAHLHRGGNDTLIDWQPTRSAETEARLRNSEVEQMLAAVNRYRRLRGAPERSLDELDGSPHPRGRDDAGD
jgi:hypothetical protein